MDDECSVVVLIHRLRCRFPAREYIPPFVGIVLDGKDAEKSAVPEYVAEILIL
jgi:hypothetical protein